MKKANITQNLFKGIGSVFDICPCPIKNPISSKTDAERLHDDWKRVGDTLYKIIASVDNEHKTTK